VSQTSENGKKTIKTGHRRSQMVKNVGLKTITVSHVQPKTVTGQNQKECIWRA